MLNQLAPHSRIWIYQANRFITTNEQAVINEKINKFIAGWASHGNELYGAHTIAENLFLIVGADEQKSPTSGCSIDSLNRFIQALGEELKINFFDRLIVAYIGANQKIELANLADFKDLIKTNLVNENTVVFNNLITTQSELNTVWKSTVKNSWHNNLLELA